MVGATGLEPAVSCSQSRRASHYATPRVWPSKQCRGTATLHFALPAGVAQWQSPSLPSWPCRFDPGHPLHRSTALAHAPNRPHAGTKGPGMTQRGHDRCSNVIWATRKPATFVSIVDLSCSSVRSRIPPYRSMPALATMASSSATSAPRRSTLLLPRPRMRPLPPTVERFSTNPRGGLSDGDNGDGEVTIKEVIAAPTACSSCAFYGQLADRPTIARDRVAAAAAHR